MKLGIRECPDGWKLIWGRDLYFLKCLSKEQAERALSLFADSPVDWDSLPNLYAASNNTLSIIARLTILVSKEFNIPLTILVTDNTQALDIIEKAAEQRPTCPA